MAPSLTGRGWGWVVFFAAEAVSRLPGPPLEDPPTSPPRNSTGARGGSAVGRLAHGLPPPRGRRSVAADVPARLAQRLQRSRPHDHEQRRLCGRRATKRSDWRGGRAAARTSLNPVFSGPATGMAGDRGGDLAGAAPSGAQRSDCASRPVRQAGLVHAQREGIRARFSPGTGKGRCVLQPALPAWPCCVRDGCPSGARRRYPGGSTRSATARPRAAGRRPVPRRPGSSASASASASATTMLEATDSAATPSISSTNLARRFASFEYFE
jgi:hypothetical protein